MPYKSKAQQRKFHADPELQKHAEKWDQETKETKKGFKGLPERKTKKKRSTKKGQNKAATENNRSKRKTNSQKSRKGTRGGKTKRGSKGK